MEMLNYSHIHKHLFIGINKLVNTFMWFIDFPSAASCYPRYMILLYAQVLVLILKEGVVSTVVDVSCHPIFQPLEYLITWWMLSYR